MGDTNVKIKLTADTKQLKNEIKLIDKELQELGGSTRSSRTKSSDTSSKKQESSSDRGSKTNTAKEESRDKIYSQLQREATLIRKELQKINKSGGSGGQTGGSGGGSTTPPTTPSSSSPTIPSDKSGGLGKLLGQLATAAVAMKAVSSAWNSLSASAKSAATGESLAYRTYGSTLAYKDYNTARKDASGLGSPYGYDYDTVMNAGNTNMSRAGFTTLDNYNTDMNAILRTSKAWGIDPSSLASASGYASSIGVAQSGDQAAFANLLAESIVDAEMTGREDEQLQVLEEISENLARVNTTVSDESLKGSLNMYNALVDQNENLKGTRGSNIVTSMQDIANSGNSSLDVLAGFGTEYTGLSGQLELRKLAEENPDEYWAKVYEGVQKYNLGDDYFKKLLYDNTGSISQSEDIMSAIAEMAQGTYNISDTSAGEAATEERIANYTGSDVSTQETYEIEKKETSDDRGDFINNMLNPFRDIYSGLPDWAQQGVDGLGFAGKVGLGIGGTKLLRMGASSVWKKFTGGAGTSTAGAGAGVADDLANAAASSVDDVANAAANSIDDIASGVANSIDDAVVAGADDIIANSADDVVGAGLKGVLGKALGPLIQLGFGAYNYATAEDDWERSGAVGQTAGGMLGGLLGGLAGPLGSIAGGWVGGELGDTIGNDVQNAKANYGTGLAALPLIGKLFTKDGTLIQQQLAGEQSDLASRFTGGKPSDYGLPKEFDDALNYYEFGDSVNADIRSGVLQNQYGYSQEELNKIYESEAFTSWLDSQGRGTHANTSGYGVGAAGDFGIDTGGEAKMVVVAKDYGDYQDQYDASKDTLNQGYYSVWTGSQEELEEYKKNRGEMMVGSDYYEKAETVGATAENPYIQSSEATASNTTALEENTEALKKLYEENGLTYGAPYSQEYVDSTLSASSDPLTGLNSKTTGSLFSLFGKSHAVGNAYIPYDNYLASLHKGEMVLDKYEADQLRQGNVGSGTSSGSGSLDININLNGSVSGMTTDNQNKIVEAIVSQLSSAGLQNMISNGFQRMQNR